MDHRVPEPGRLVRLTHKFTGAINTPKEHTHAIIVSGELAYGQYARALVGEVIFFLSAWDYEVLDEAG